jgi:ParB family chromosome partitioning protein
MLQRIKRKSFYKNDRVSYISVHSIEPNPAQPRRLFDPDGLRELADSIRENGVLQPITVRSCGNKYVLVAGERRLRASRMAGLGEIPCIITRMDEKQSSLIALVENLQRCDLDFFEEAEGIRRMIHTYGFSQEEAARKLGKSQSAISNKLRLLRLSPRVIKEISLNSLTERHARALLRLKNEQQQLTAIKHIAEKKYNVSQTEEYIEKLICRNADKKSAQARKPRYIIKDVRLFLNTITRAINTMRLSGVRTDFFEEEDDSAIYMRICIFKGA